MSEDARAVSDHYGRQHLGDSIRDGLQAAGKGRGPLTTDDLAPFDQFHIGGKATTQELARLATFQPAWQVLDVGGGLGGPARTLAQEVGCQVTVLDLTPEFCDVGTWLTEQTGLADRVQLQVGDALDMPFSDGQFDAAWTQHSSMNIEDKESLYQQIHRVVRLGGRLALHEIMAGPQEPAHFPVPWAAEPSISFLRQPEAIRALLTSLGFREITWIDRSAHAIAWFREQVAAARARAAPPHLGLHLLLGASAPTMFGNVLRNLEEGRLTTIQAVVKRV